MRLLKIRDPIPVQANVDIVSQPYQFEYNWTNVNNTFINFHESYLSLRVWVPRSSPEDLDEPLEQPHPHWHPHPYIDDVGRIIQNPYELQQEEAITFFLDYMLQNTNIYCIIDSVDVEMVYGLSDGSTKALKYHEPCMHAARGRKMIALKEQSSYDLDKSVYCEDLSTPKDKLRSLAYIRSHSDEEIEILIPLYLVCGLGTTRDNLINVRQLKMLFRTSTIDALVKNSLQGDVFPCYRLPAQPDADNPLEGANAVWQAPTDQNNNAMNLNWFESFQIKSADMLLMTYQGLKFDRVTINRTIPSYIQVDYQNYPISQETFLVNRALPYIPEYVLFWFTYDYKPSKPDNVPTTGIWPVYLSCLMGNMQMFPQTDFPSMKYMNNKELPNKEVREKVYDAYRPNHLLYDLWSQHAHPETKLNYEKWLKHPVYIVPCNALMDVTPQSGIEMNFEMRVELHDYYKKLEDQLDFPDGRVRITRDGGEAGGDYGAPRFEVDTHPGYELYAINNFHERYTHIPDIGDLQDDGVDLDRDFVYTLHMLAVRSIRDI